MVNSLYFIAYGAITGRRFEETGFPSIIASSLLPPILGALGAYGLSLFTEKAALIFIVTTLVITLLSLWPTFSPTLPHGFGALVLPMHVVVGLAAAVLIPFFLRTRS